MKGSSVSKPVWTMLVLLVLVFVGCNSSDGGNGPDGSAGDAGVLNHNQVLEELGVTTELEPRKDPDGQELKEDYNPMGARLSNLRRLTELYVGGMSWPQSTNEIVVDHGPTDFGPTLFEGSQGDDWKALPKASIAGDFDGDGREEIAVLVLNNIQASGRYRRLYLRIIEDKEESYAIEEVTISESVEVERFRPLSWGGHTEQSGDYLHKLDIAAGDLDGDGTDEIFVTCLSDLWVLDDRAAEYAVIETLSFPIDPGAEMQVLRVGEGDTDGDGKAEVIVIDGQMAEASGNNGTGTATFHIYEDQALTEVESGPVMVTVSATSYLLMTAEVAVGDLDGDRLNEIVFWGRQSGEYQEGVLDYNQTILLVMDNGRAGYGFRKAIYTHGMGDWIQRAPVGRIEIADIDGDNQAEVVTSAGWILEWRSVGLEWDGGVSDSFMSASLVVSDLTGDGIADVAVIPATGNSAYTNTVNVRVSGIDDQGVFQFALYELYGMARDLGTDIPTLTAADVDGDSAVIEYQGHEVLFTEPLLLAVMAAPPSYQNVPMDLGQAGTTFGKGSGTTVEASESLGFTVGMSVGVQANALFGSGSVKLSVEAGMDWISSESREITRAYYYHGSSSSDKVVFVSVPFDVYYYKVLASPVPSDVGTTMVINIPREPKTLFVDREFFNANNGSFDDIKENVLGHTIGDPYTYPREASLNKADLKLYADTMTVGQGAGRQTIEICLSDSQGSGVAFDLSVKVEAEVAAGSPFVKGTAGVSGGFHYGFDYTITSHRTTYYSGSVGNIIDSADWTEHRFDFGFYVKEAVVAGQKFPLIGYWVN